MKKATLIITTYKKIRELELIYSALENQTCKDFEIIIADDGSGKEVEEYVKLIRDNSEFYINFITQEKEGFRKTKILNKAIISSNTDYLVFIDGDCIPNRDFMKYHIEYAEENTVLCGWRVSLGKKISERISTDEINSGKYENNKFRLLTDSLTGKKSTKSAEESIIIKNKFLRKHFSEKRVRLTGYNFSVWKSLLEKINGFDENYVGAGIGEDTDIEYRLKLAGAKFKSIRNLAVVFHLFHEKTIEENKNLEYFRNIISKSKNYFCSNGLIKK
jgi:glycosyltransferase involved in cell wall biosynthesis